MIITISAIRQLIIILLALLSSQALPVQVEENEPEQISVGCEFYFNSWEINKEVNGATGIFFWLGDEALIFAKNELSALHEVGHLVDIQRGISMTAEFQSAVDSYLGEEWDGEDMVYYRLSFLFYQGGGYGEVYAELYMMNIVSMNYELDPMPAIFRPFYR